MTFARSPSVVLCVLPEVCDLVTWDIQPTRCSTLVSLFSHTRLEMEPNFGRRICATASRTHHVDTSLTTIATHHWCLIRKNSERDSILIFNWNPTQNTCTPTFQKVVWLRMYTWSECTLLDVQCTFLNEELKSINSWHSSPERAQAVLLNLFFAVPLNCVKNLYIPISFALDFFVLTVSPETKLCLAPDRQLNRKSLLLLMEV